MATGYTAGIFVTTTATQTGTKRSLPAMATHLRSLEKQREMESKTTSNLQPPARRSSNLPRTPTPQQNTRTRERARVRRIRLSQKTIILEA